MTWQHVTMIFFACLLIGVTVALCAIHPSCENGVLPQVIQVSLVIIAGTVGHASRGFFRVHQSGSKQVQEVIDPSLLDSQKRPMGG